MTTSPKTSTNAMTMTTTLVRTALNNAGLPDITDKILTNDDIKNLTQEDKQRIRCRIKEFDDYYKHGFATSTTRKMLLTLLGDE